MNNFLIDRITELLEELRDESEILIGSVKKEPDLDFKIFRVKMTRSRKSKMTPFFRRVRTSDDFKDFI